MILFKDVLIDILDFFWEDYPYIRMMGTLKDEEYININRTATPMTPLLLTLSR